jgi:hypothetical protein
MAHEVKGRTDSIKGENMSFKGWHVDWSIPVGIIIMLLNCYAFLVTGSLFNLLVAGLLTYAIAKGWSLLVYRRHRHDE